jgi:dephospho-CoA kinase
MASPSFRCIGLTGGICAGKSSILSYLSTLGAGIIENDKVAHQLYEPGTEVHQQVLAAFPSLRTDTPMPIDRKALGDLIFHDPSKRETLNSIVWPAVRAHVSQLVQTYRESGYPAAVVVCARGAAALGGRRVGS